MTRELIQKRIRKSLNASWIEGLPSAVMLGIMDNFIIPLGLFLGASPKQIGILVAVPHLVGSVAQLYAVPAVRAAGSRKHFLVSGAFLQASFILPIAGIAYTRGAWTISFLIAVVAIYRVIGNFIGVAWGSLVSDYLPPQKRGDFFGWRAQITGVAGLVGIAGAGFFLYWMKQINPVLGFSLLFLSATVCRIISGMLMSGFIDLPHPESKQNDFTFGMFLRRFRESNFVKFVLYVAGISFATHMAAPYFSVYMLRDLHFNYLAYAAVQFASVTASLVAFPIWGRHADVVGNAKILKVTSVLIPGIPLLWLLSRNPIVLVLIETFSGLIWGGFNLCAANFIYDAVSPGKRVRCLGYFNFINGLAISCGSFLGGFLADKLPPTAGYRLLTLFLLSGLLRWIAHLFLSANFSEVRQETRHKISSLQLFFSVVGMRPLAGMDHEWNLFPSLVLRRTFDVEWLMKRLQDQPVPKEKKKNEPLS